MKTRADGIARRWRATRTARFIAEFNADAGGTQTLSARFRSTGRWSLALALAGVTLFAIAVRIPLLGVAYSAADTGQYLETAAGIFHGGFANDLRPPGFPLLLSAFELVGADPVDGVVLLQNLVGIVLPAFVLLVGWRHFSLAVGLAAGFLTAASPLMISIEQLALPDYFFGVAFFIGAVLLAEAVLQIRSGSPDWRLLAASGAMFGLATLLRANGLIGLVAIPIVLLMGSRQWRPALRATGVAVAATAVVLAPWFLHNLVKFGDPSISTESGISLYARAISWDEVAPSTDTADGRLALSVYNTAEFGAFRGALATTTGVYNALVAQGKMPTEASAAMGAIARDAIARHPGAYTNGTFEILGLYQSVFDPRTLTANQYLDQIVTARSYFRSLRHKGQEIPGDSALTRTPWQAAQTLTRLLYVITLGGVLALGLLFLGSAGGRLAAATFLIASLLAIVGVSMTARWEPRYGIAFAPMFWILGAATVALLARIIAAAVRRRPWFRAQDAPT